MRRKLGLLALVFVATLSFSLAADTVLLLDGSTVEGEIIAEDAMSIVVKTRAGKATIAKAEIKEIMKKAPLSPVLAGLRDKIDALQKTDEKNIKAWVDLGLQAKGAAARSEMYSIFERVLTLEPENPTARTEMGYVLRDGLWIKGLSGGAEKLVPDALVQPATPALPLSDRDRIKAMAGVSEFSNPNEKAVDCPKCHGSGVLISLNCTTCAKSAKKGFKLMADGRYVPCERCNGTTKAPAVFCVLCNRSGKVMLSRIPPWESGTRKAPEGTSWCATCNGTGWEGYKDCQRCRGSQWPGYVSHGDYVTICDRCNGNAKIPETQCTHCNGKGIVPAAPAPAENK